MQRINYKSDFDFILTLTDCNGEQIGWPDYDWSARIYTSQLAKAVTVCCIGGKAVNCFNDDGQIHVVMDNHGLRPGQLMVEFRALLPSDIYPDGKQTIVTPTPLDIELTASAGCECGVSAEVKMPVIVKDSDGKKQREFRIDPVLRRKTIPLNAQPGIVYHNPNGWVRLPWGGDDLVKTFDLSKAFPNGLPEGWELVDPLQGRPNDIVSADYNAESNRLTVTRFNAKCGVVIKLKNAPGVCCMATKSGRLVWCQEYPTAMAASRPERPSRKEIEAFLLVRQDHLTQGSRSERAFDIQRRRTFSWELTDHRCQKRKKWCGIERFQRVSRGVFRIRRRVRGCLRSDWCVFSAKYDPANLRWVVKILY